MALSGDNDFFDPNFIMDLTGRPYRQTYETSCLDNEMLVGMRIAPVQFNADGKIIIEGKLIEWTKNT